MFLYARALKRRVEVEYETGGNEALAARLEQLASSLAQSVRGPEAERNLESARKEKRDAESLKIYAGQQRQEVDGTTAAVFADTRAHIAQRL